MTENTLLWWALYAVVMGAINTWRGRGYVANSRYYAIALWSIVSLLAAHFISGYALGSSALLGLVIGAGCFYWLEHPWGQGFAAYTGVWEPRPNTVHWIENICLKLYPYPGAGQPDPKAYARGTLFMALRGLYIAPLFAVMVLVTSKLWVVALGLVGLMQGLAYGCQRYVKPCQIGNWNCQAANAEFLTMASFAVAFSYCL